MLTNSAKISDTTKRELLELTYFQGDQKKKTKILLCRIMQCFGDFKVFTIHKCSDTGLFGHLSNPAFCSLYFQKQIISEAHIFSKYSKLYVDCGNAEKNLEITFDLEIIAFKLVALNTRFYWERILVIGCQYVNKQSPDFRYY